MTDADAKQVARAAENLLGPKEQWFFPGGYRDSLAHAILDSVYSLRAKYGVVASVRRRYDSARGEAHGGGTEELVAAIDEAGGAVAAAQTLFDNRNKAPGTDRLKSVAVYDAAVALQAAGIRSAGDLREASSDADRLSEVRDAWTSVAGLGKVSWNYLLMLAGVDGTKPDVMVRRFVCQAVDGDKGVSADRARAAVTGAAAILDVPISVLDHTIWRYQSGRAAGPEVLSAETQ